MPNTNETGDQKWSDFRVSVDAIEQQTGYDLLSSLPVSTQQVLEAGTDKIAVQSVYIIPRAYSENRLIDF
ncbi:hypothetical protein [Spirosoma spitsbergense]|uniref:hypothetical protein n=1 Tax=Spirosoma spitsbergense TaxID=431554 RepID=UPI0003A23837